MGIIPWPAGRLAAGVMGRWYCTIVQSRFPKPAGSSRRAASHLFVFFTATSFPTHAEGNVQRCFFFLPPKSWQCSPLTQVTCLPPPQSSCCVFPPPLVQTYRQADRQGHMNWTLCCCWVFFFNSGQVVKFLMMFFQWVGESGGPPRFNAFYHKYDSYKSCSIWFI